MEQAFVAMILAQAGITSLIGTGANARLYALLLPQKFTRPALTYQVISGPRDYTQDGPDGVITFRIQLDLWADSYADLVTLRDAIAIAISGLHHLPFGSPAVMIHGVFIGAERDFYEGAFNTPGPRLFRKALDLMVTADQL